ncbi:N-(5'-phosphoribosyl)anthranilate isomerase [Methylocystis bryophila]|uniref:N-(5'-phosphoribosyl)anthranilate isomerase n=1 Tax=Methylocystis bryophila TaxID=655015 RepID=A0A1W6N067_9HYPH|nr:N-(5'-phosphoribosyl)anthranilate isomerase [Methylocystis bryophila]
MWGRRPARGTIVKICGLRTIDALEASIEAGADLAGFVFFEKSPRHLTLDAARALVARAAGRIGMVALTVDADDERLAAIIAAIQPDFLQFHGHEAPERVREAKARFKLPVIKAIGVGGREDLVAAKAYAEADMILYDAKPSPGAARPGGMGRAFDWGLLNEAPREKPWLLSGGLSPETVAEAVRITGAPGVDVSSGVESAPGQKDPSRIAAFLHAARGAAGGEAR